MLNYDTLRHVKGESVFLDDISLPDDTLYGYVYYSRVAHGRIKLLDTREAKNSNGVKCVITANDIPGINQIGGIIQDEELLAAGCVNYIGEPVALVLAKSEKEAREAAGKIKLEAEELPVITDAREAFIKGELIMPPRIIACGNTEEAWNDCDIVVEGSVETGAQEHLYLETQGSIAYPVEGGGLKIISSTQAPTSGQRCAAKVCGLPMNMVEVDVKRLGGGFGGKEDQANAWCALAALGAFISKKTVKLVLNRQDDMRITGKRHPYSSDYKLGLKKDGTFIAYEVVFYQNAGATADLSPAILDRTLFHCNNVYSIPNIKATGYSCRTNLPPNTAFRGFGGPQGLFVIEAAIYKAAEKLGVEPYVLQRKNMFTDGGAFPYGQVIENSRAIETWDEAVAKYNFDEIRSKVENFNRENKLLKKGVALMPLCFGISFTNTFMNQASALVHIYNDGSISINTGAIEMGQGVNTKIRQVAAFVLSVDIARVKIESTNTTRVANTSPTAASSAADLNGKATENACLILKERLIGFAKAILKTTEKDSLEIINENVFVNGNNINFGWQELVNTAFFNRVNLSAQAQYATPDIFFDSKTAKGKPFAYHSYGTGIVEATVDCLRGTYEIDSVKVVHDFGKSLNPLIDRGQAEGAILQGIGWVTMEEIIFNNKGRLVTDALSTYKIPDLNFAPRMDIAFLANDNNPLGLFNSKAIGEPPLLYGIGAYFALMNAIKEFRKGVSFQISAPLTNEKALMCLYTNKYTEK